MQQEDHLQHTLSNSIPKNIVICIPAFNEESHIPEIIERCKRYGNKVIVYDDGSIDNTENVAMIAGASVIRHSVNKGYGAALATLFNEAKLNNADIVVTIDSDGQHDPDQIPAIIEPLLKGDSDIVIGSRFLQKSDQDKIPKYRSMGIKAITSVTQRASYRTITDSQSGFRAYNRSALQQIHISESGMAISTEILLRAKEKNLRIKEVPITVRYDLGTTSTHNPFVHGIAVLANVLQHLSLKHPLLFYGLPGIFFLIVAAFFTNYALDIFSSTRFVSTNLILVSIGLAVVGVILLATGAIVYTLIALFKGKVKDL